MENGERIHCIGDQPLKDFLPIYFKRIEKHYKSSAPAPPLQLQHISKLSPLHLHRKWNKASYKESPFAPSVVSVSFFYGVQRIIDCSGFIIHWDHSNGIATVLTSAKLLSTTPFKRHDYYIVVRLANGKLLLAEEDYVDYYHNIVTFKVNSDAKLIPLDLDSPPLENLEGVEVVALARSFHNCELSESCGFIRIDYPYFGCEQLVSSTCSSDWAGEGGPLITKAGQIIGINFYDGYGYVHPLPTSVISLCLRIWNSNGIVIRPWLGFTVIDIANLPPDTYETMHEFSVDSSVVVKEVYKGSPADKVGVRSGDSINAVNGMKLCSVQKYAELLDGVSEKLSACRPNQTDTTVYKGSPADKVGVRSGDSINAVDGMELSCVQRYAELLNGVSEKLSACRPNQTDTTVSVCVNDKLVRAENLSVDDKNFCSSWLGDETDWTFIQPLIGSQTDPLFDRYSAW